MAKQEQIKFGKALRRLIVESKESFEALAMLHLAKSSEDAIKTIMKNKSKLSNKKAFLATNDVVLKGRTAYRKQVDELTAMVINEAWGLLVDYVGVKTAIKFKTEFEKLPKATRERIRKTSDLLVGSHYADLERKLFFSYDDAISADLADKEILYKLEQEAENFYTGASMRAGSAKVATEYINHSVRAYYALEEVSEELEGLLYYNPNPKSSICLELTGKFFALNDPLLSQYTPPNHWNCKSTLVPVLKGHLPKGAKVEKINPSKKARSSVQFSEQLETNKLIEVINESKREV